MWLNSTIFSSIINHNKKVSSVNYCKCVTMKMPMRLESLQVFQRKWSIAHALGRTPNKMSFVKVSQNSSRYRRCGFRCSALSFSRSCMTLLEHIRWNFNVPCGQIGSLHLYVRGKLDHIACIGILHWLWRSRGLMRTKDVPLMMKSRFKPLSH